jgi:CheY-like chemotaxis protein
MRKILIVDDEPHITMVLKHFLERSKLSVLSALNGNRASELISKHRPEVIIADVHMPGPNGLDLCEKILQQMPDYHPLFILMTSRLDRDSRSWSQQHDSVVIMEKPLSCWRVLVCLRTYFGNFKF